MSVFCLKLNGGKLTRRFGLILNPVILLGPGQDRPSSCSGRISRSLPRSLPYFSRSMDSELTRRPPPDLRELAILSHFLSLPTHVRRPTCICGQPSRAGIPQSTTSSIGSRRLARNRSGSPSRVTRHNVHALRDINGHASFPVGTSMHRRLTAMSCLVFSLSWGVSSFPYRLLEVHPRDIFGQRVSGREGRAWKGGAQAICRASSASAPLQCVPRDHDTRSFLSWWRTHV